MTCLWLLLVEASALGTISDVVSSIPSLSAFSGILHARGQESILSTMSGPGPFTLFAPTNAAFEQAGLQPTDDRSIAAILNLHLSKGRVNYANMNPLFFVETLLTDSQYTNRGPGLGALLRVSKANEQVIINGMAYILTADIPASNGIIHLIDAVLSPPEPTLTVASKSGFSRWVAAVQSASVVPTVRDTAGITFFVPNNKALAAVDLNAGNSAELRALVQSWAVYGTITTNTLQDGASLRAIDGSILSVKITGKQIRIGGALLGQKDLLTRNGVIHGADTAYPEVPPPATVAPAAATRSMALPAPVDIPVAARLAPLNPAATAAVIAPAVAAPPAPEASKIPTPPPPPPVPVPALPAASAGLQLSPELCQQAKVLFPTMFDQVDCSVFSVPSVTRQSTVRAVPVPPPTIGPRPVATTLPPTPAPRPLQTPPPPPTSPPPQQQTPMQRSALLQPSQQVQAQAQLPVAQQVQSPQLPVPSFTPLLQTQAQFSSQQALSPSLSFGTTALSRPLQQSTVASSQWAPASQYSFPTQPQVQPQLQGQFITQTQFQAQPQLQSQFQASAQLQTQFQAQPQFTTQTQFPSQFSVSQPQAQFSQFPTTTQSQFSQFPLQTQNSFLPQTTQFQTSFQSPQLSSQRSLSLSPSFSAFGQTYWP